MKTQSMLPLYGGMAAMALLFVAMALPMIRGSVKPNHWYGVRTPKTFASPELWYRANHHAGYAMLAAVGVSVLLWAALAFVPFAQPRTRFLIDLFSLSGLLVGALLLSAGRSGAF